MHPCHHTTYCTCVLHMYVWVTIPSHCNTDYSSVLIHSSHPTCHNCHTAHPHQTLHPLLTPHPPQAIEQIMCMYEMFRDKDCTILEINPFAEDKLNRGTVYILVHVHVHVQYTCILSAEYCTCTCTCAYAMISFQHNPYSGMVYSTYLCHSVWLLP